MFRVCCLEFTLPPLPVMPAKAGIQRSKDEKQYYMYAPDVDSRLRGNDEGGRNDKAGQMKSKAIMQIISPTCHTRGNPPDTCRDQEQAGIQKSRQVFFSFPDTILLTNPAENRIPGYYLGII